MTAPSTVCEEHPQFVSIPDPRSARGLRAYDEPAEPHPLQRLFLDPQAEAAWTRQLCDLLAGNRADEAHARLAAELAGFHGTLATLCKATGPDDVVLEGWDDLVPIIAEWEGPPITAITIGLTNMPDMVFGDAPSADPELLVRLYSDDAFPFGRSSKADLVEQANREEPGWVGAEEDVEFYCQLTGAAELNAALIGCKHRHFLRQGGEERAPGGYVEYVLGCWVLATRFLQAVTRAVSEHGMPPGCRLLAGTVDLNADFLTVIGAERPARKAQPAKTAEPRFAALTSMPFVPRQEPAMDAAEAAPAPTFRQRVTTPDTGSERPAGQGFLARLFARLRGGRPTGR